MQPTTTGVRAAARKKNTKVIDFAYQEAWLMGLLSRYAAQLCGGMLVGAKKKESPKNKGKEGLMKPRSNKKWAPESVRTLKDGPDIYTSRAETQF